MLEWEREIERERKKSDKKENKRVLFFFTEIVKSNVLYNDQLYIQSKIVRLRLRQANSRILFVLYKWTVVLEIGRRHAFDYKGITCRYRGNRNYM